MYKCVVSCEVGGKKMLLCFYTFPKLYINLSKNIIAIVIIIKLCKTKGKSRYFMKWQ
jgi:hypothetical protein